MGTSSRFRFKFWRAMRSASIAFRSKPLIPKDAGTGLTLSGLGSPFWWAGFIGLVAFCSERDIAMASLRSSSDSVSEPGEDWVKSIGLAIFAFDGGVLGALVGKWSGGAVLKLLILGWMDWLLRAMGGLEKGMRRKRVDIHRAYRQGRWVDRRYSLE